MAHGTIPTGRVTGAVGGAAGSSRYRGVVTDVVVVVVPMKTIRAVRRGLCGGAALGFELTACDVVLTDFDASSGPQFVCFAYGARDAGVEEDAFR